MTESVQEVMTWNPVTLSSSTTIFEAARVMRDRSIGDVIVLDEEDRLCGIVTDRDIVVRCVAEGDDPTEVYLGDICSRQLTTVDVDTSMHDAVRLMREKAVRRLPVLDHGRPAGIVTIGDLALDIDPDSALADISAAPANC